MVCAPFGVCYLGTVQPVSACSQHAIAATCSQSLRHDQTRLEQSAEQPGRRPWSRRSAARLALRSRVCRCRCAQLERRGGPSGSITLRSAVGWRRLGRRRPDRRKDRSSRLVRRPHLAAGTPPLTDGAVISRPAAELTRLRQETIDYQPGTTLELSAYEVSARNGLQLRLIDTAGRQQLVAEAVGPVRLLVDGSLVELCGPATPHTTRAYPTPTTTG